MVFTHLEWGTTLGNQTRMLCVKPELASAALVSPWGISPSRCCPLGRLLLETRQGPAWLGAQRGHCGHMPSTVSSNCIQGLGACCWGRAVPQTCPILSRAIVAPLPRARVPLYSASGCDRTPTNSSFRNPEWICRCSCSSGKTFTLVGVSPLPRPMTDSQGNLLYVDQVPEEAH